MHDLILTASSKRCLDTVFEYCLNKTSHSVEILAYFQVVENDCASIQFQFISYMYHVVSDLIYSNPLERAFEQELHIRPSAL